MTKMTYKQHLNWIKMEKIKAIRIKKNESLEEYQ